MSIGLPKGMSRDDAYIQGLHDAEEHAALTIRTLSEASGHCPGSWMRLEQQLPRPETLPCPECGMDVHLTFDQDNTAFYGGHTINLKCRWCNSTYVNATGKASVRCYHCKGIGKGIPIDS